MADTTYKVKMSSWITVALVVVASILLAVGLVAKSVPLGVIGALMLVVGVVLGITGKIMEDAH